MSEQVKQSHSSMIRTIVHPNGSPVPYCLPDEWIASPPDDHNGWCVRVREKVQKFKRQYIHIDITQDEAERIVREHNAPIFREAARQLVLGAAAAFDVDPVATLRTQLNRRAGLPHRRDQAGGGLGGGGEGGTGAPDTTWLCRTHRRPRGGIAPASFGIRIRPRPHRRPAGGGGEEVKVGVLCEFSGTVRDAFIRRGHDAVSCDLLPTETPGPHIQGDCLAQDWSGFDLLICHPPCTFLCSSGLHRNVNNRERQAKTETALQFVRDLLALPVPRIGLENPIGRISSAIRKPDQIIQPYQYGADASKATCLWLKGLPRLRCTRTVDPRIVWDADGWPAMRWSNQTDSGQNRLGPSADRWAERSLTYPGIAEAMAAQWGKHP